MTEYDEFERFYLSCMEYSYSSRVRRILSKQSTTFLAAGTYYWVRQYRCGILPYCVQVPYSAVLDR